MDASFLPRGLRNHNPLNIRKSADKWQGSAKVQADKSFVTFVSNAYGYRAAMKTIKTYMSRGRVTPDQIIKQWAPPSENNTEGYIRNVCSMSGIGRNEKVSLRNEEQMVALIHAMAIVENGIKYLEFIKEEEIRQGFHLAFG